jgi:hypothetical protein
MSHVNIDAHMGRGGGKDRRGAPHVPPIKNFEKHDPPDFLTTPSTPLKKICQKNQGPPWISNYCVSMDVNFEPIYNNFFILHICI